MFLTDSPYTNTSRAASIKFKTQYKHTSHESNSHADHHIPKCLNWVKQSIKTLLVPGLTDKYKTPTVSSGHLLFLSFFIVSQLCFFKRMLLSAGTGSSSLEDDPAEAFLQTKTNGPCDEAFFQRGAVQLARHLVGQYLYFHASKTAVRILETEAYPAGDAVYDIRFRERSPSQFKLKGGILMTWRPAHYRTDFGDLYVSVGPEDNEDLVHIRSCEPALGSEVILNRRKNPISPWIKKNLLIGPHNCTEGVGTEWLADPKLYRDARGGVQLFCATPDPATERMRCGPRVLNNSYYYGCYGTDFPYRFALLTRANYSYFPGLQDV